MRRILALVVCMLLVFGLIPPQNALADEFLEDEPFVGTFSGSNEDSAEMLKIEAGAAIVLDAKSGRVLFEKNAYSRRAMASTTKIMTAIVAIENGSLDGKVTVSRRAAEIWGSRIGLRTDETMTLEELLYGMMLSSGNDAAIAIAEHIGGTVENFLDMMNRKAIEIGAKDTNFKSPHGLDMDGHYTTAYDLGIITQYALENPVFSRIVGTKSATIPNRGLYNTNEMLDVYPGADGVKTGYTGKAGRCLVTSATRDDWRIISVVLNCSSRFTRAQSSKSILDYAFNNYKPYFLLRKGDFIKKLPVVKGISDYVAVEAMDDLYIPLRFDEVNSVETQLVLPESITAPVYMGVEAGTVNFILNGKVIAHSGLKTTSGVRRKEFLDYLEGIFSTWHRFMREGIFLES